MVFSVFSVLSIVSVFSTWMMLISISRAATITSPPEALITRAPLVRREESSVGTFGYFSASESDGTTSWVAWTYDLSKPIITSTSGVWLDWCGEDWCDLFTTCGDNTLAGPSQTTTCKSGSSCHTEYQFQSYGASDPLLSKVACNANNYVTKTYFVERPASIIDSTSSTADTTTADTTTTSAATTTATTSETSTSVVKPPPSGDSGGGTSKTGVIAGSVVGGVALICISVLFAFWMRRRKSHRTYSNNPNPTLGVHDPYETVQVPKYAYNSHMAQAVELPAPQYSSPSELPSSTSELPGTTLESKSY